MRSHIDIFPLGEVDETAVSVVAANLQALTGLNAAVLPALPDPDYAYLSIRNQYAAAEIVKTLASFNDGAPLKLGIVECDLCTPILKFVFGESQLGGKAAVMSLHRLFSQDPEKTYLRAAKIGLHETGHILGIGHCRSHDCLMAFAASLDRIDSLPLRFCAPCQYEMSRRLKHLFG